VQNVLSSSLLSKNVKNKVYRSIILLVVLCECETWSLTLREERRLRVLENRVLKRIFGPKRDEATGEWRKQHNEELNDLYSSPIIVRVIKSRRMRWVGPVAHMGERRGVYRVLVGKREGRRQLGWPRRRWEDNIKMDLQDLGCGVMDWIDLGCGGMDWIDLGCGGMDWIDLAQDRDRWRVFVNAVRDLQFPYNAENYLTS